MKIAIIGSGKGSNAKAIIEAEKNGLLGMGQIVGIFSDIEKSGILDIANEYSVNCKWLECNSDSARLNNEDALKWIKILDDYSPDLIVLAGLMKIVPKVFIDHYDGKIINLHPSLLPSFKGINAIQQAHEYGVKISGCTIHWVSEDLDAGKIIAQAPVRLMPSDSLDACVQKIRGAEHTLLPMTVANLSFEFKDMQH